MKNAFLLCVCLFFLKAPNIHAQLVTTSTDSLARNINVRDSTCSLPCVPLERLLRLQSHNAADWFQQLPHVWLRPDLQPGQPAMIQFMGRPPWTTKVDWFGMSMEDPVFGMPVLQVIPIIAGRGISAAQESPGMNIRILRDTLSANRPVSRVYYLQGGSGLSTVDGMFSKRIGRSGFFSMGGNFFRNGGLFSNSDVENDRFRAGVVIPAGGSLLTYHASTTRSSGGFPGDISGTGAVEFSLLRRKVRRQDHLLRLDLLSPGNLHKSIQLQYHQDRRDYTDNQSAQINTEDRARWGMISGLVSYRTGKAAYRLGIHVIGESGASLFPAEPQGPSEEETGSARKTVGFSEYPVRISLAGLLLKKQQIGINLGFQYHDRNRRSHEAEVSWQSSFAKEIELNISLFDLTRVPPLGWRNGRIMPFENHPWPINFDHPDSTFWAKNTPNGTVGYRGTRVQLHWKNASRSQVFGDFYLQSIRGLNYPRSNISGVTTFDEAGDFLAAGVFVSGSQKIGGSLDASLNYQYSFRDDGDSTDVSGIPDHRIWARLAYHRWLFRGNLLLRMAFAGEGLTSRSGFSRESGSGNIVSTQLREMFLFHARLDLEIGDAQIFFQLQDLTGQKSETAGFFLPDGMQFQYGVIWTFLD